MRAESLSAAHKRAQRAGWARSPHSSVPPVRLACAALERTGQGDVLQPPLRRAAIRAALERVAAGHVDPRSPEGRAILHVLARTPDALVKTLRRHPDLIPTPKNEAALNLREAG